MGPSTKLGSGEVRGRAWEQHPVHQLLSTPTCLARGLASRGVGTRGSHRLTGRQGVNPGEFNNKPRSQEEAVNATMRAARTLGANRKPGKTGVGMGWSTRVAFREEGC